MSSSSASFDADSFAAREIHARTRIARTKAIFTQVGGGSGAAVLSTAQQARLHGGLALRLMPATA